MSVFRWTDAAVREALGLPDGEGAGEGAGEGVYPRVSTDSRTLEAGDLFVALEGTSFDGHDFVDQAVAAGARGVVLRRPVDVAEGVRTYRVDDTLVALGRLARFRRSITRAPGPAASGQAARRRGRAAGTLSS